MGKIRIKTIGADEDPHRPVQGGAPEKKVKKEKKKTHLPGMGGGERVVVVGPSEEELATPVEARKTKKAKFQKPKHLRSKQYQTIAKMVEKKEYSIPEALELLEKMKRQSFDETVEIHINTLAPGIASTVTLPHGAGKKIRVAIASDLLLAEVEKGKIEFDILLATPAMMPKLAKVAKILGPKGLMPNPKSGTISEKPESLVKKYEGGLVSFKTESKAPILHLSVGKVSFGREKLKENIETILNAVKKENIKDATLKSTMSPGIKISV